MMIRTIAANAAALGALLLSSPAVRGATPNDKTWEVEGVMSDACQCSVYCACEFNDKPTAGHCDDAAMLSIQRGHFGAVKLDGLRVAVVTQSPEGERVIDSIGHLNFAHIYLPKSSSEEQARALAEVARRSLGTFAGGVAKISLHEEVVRAPIEATLTPTRHTIRIPGVLDLEIEAMTGGDGTTPIKIANHPFSPLGFGDPLVARSKVYTYTHGNVRWDYKGHTASIRTFKLSGDVQPPPASAAPAASSAGASTPQN